MKKTIAKWMMVGLLTVNLPMMTLQGQAQTETKPLEQVTQAYKDKVDVKYSYDLTNKMAEFRTNEKLGYRPAGSPAEHEAGIYLAEEMEKIGLTQVTSDEFTVDSWTFDHAELTFKNVDGKEVTAVMGAYQINMDTQGPKDYELVYLNKGTAKDYENVDVKGKIVLVDINQMEEWWITYPAYEAKLHGAAAVIALQEAGFGEVSPDSLNANDICGPADAPAFSMSNTDGNVLKEALKANNNQVTVTLDAKSQVELGGKAYNISGRIEGRDKDSYILYSAHYDAYFDGFQDDSAAIGLLMGIAKAMVESGYQPEKTIIFNALAAEEWGVSDSRYDWSTGAYNQIFKVHPEWQGKAVANINFELPAMSHNPSDQIGSVYELATYLNEFAKTAEVPKDLYPEGVKVLSPNTTWADDWSFSIAGVPSIRNRFESNFRNTHYHSQFDNKDTYNEQAFAHHHKIYGILGMTLDRTAVVPLDFTTPLQLMKESIDKDGFKAAEVDAKTLEETLDQVVTDVKPLNEKIQKINQNYFKALEEGDREVADKIYADSRTLNSQVLEAYRFIQDSFVRLTWEDEQKFPHELVTHNLTNLGLAKEALEAKDATKALDEYLWAVDNNWYAYDFSQETYDHFTDYVLNQPADRLMWGAGRVVSYVNLFVTIKSLQAKVEKKETDFTSEIQILEQAEKDQSQLLKELVDKEVADLEQLKTLINK